MKFTCDSCHAQYMIGDEKLGQRGVKVRCKKCSYVIILRPQGYQPKKGSSPPPPPTGDLEDSDHNATVQDRAISDLEGDERPVTLPEDAFGPTTPFTAPHAAASDVKSAPGMPADIEATSSEMGLSRDFAAMGFDVGGIDVQKMDPVFPDQSSPFSIGRTGGSLNEPMRDHEDDEGETMAGDGPPTRKFTQPKPDSRNKGLGALGASLPKLHLEDDSHEATSLDNRTIRIPAGDEPSPFGDDEQGESTAPGRDEPAPGHKAEMEGFEASSVEERIAALEKDELSDMESSLNKALQREDRNRAAARPRQAMGKEEVTDADNRAPTHPNLASLTALAEDSFDDGPARAPKPRNVSFAQQRIVASAEHGARKDPQLENEIGSAFDAMFSPASAPSAAYQENGLQATTVQDATPETFGLAFSDPEANKKPTRIFDIQAMQQVQAEQDIAGRGTNGHGNGAAPAAAEQIDWYVAINDEQIGPMSLEEVQKHWDKQDIGPASLCWKAGMGDWSPIKTVKELEVLGNMEEEVQTVVARVESRDEISGPLEPPSIAMPESKPTPVQETPELDEPSEPSWRPSAASALASLAAEEIGDPAKSKADKKDVAIGRALPATSDALEKLLQGESKSSSPAGSSPFGSLEQSSSSIRPLPKRTDVQSSVSLRDPISQRKQPNYLLFAVIVGGFLFLAAVVVAIAFFIRPAPAPQPAQVAAQNAPIPVLSHENAQVAAAQPAAGQQVAGAQPAAGQQGAAGQQAAAQTPATAQAQGQQAAAQQGQQQAVAQAQALGGQPPQGTAPHPQDDGAEARKARRTGTRSPTGLGASGSSGQGTARKSIGREREEKKAAAEPERAAPPPREEPKSEEEDLLGAAGKPKKRVIQKDDDAPAGLPKQLEDGDILRAIRKHGDDIKNCLAKQKSADPTLDGAMTVSFVIEGTGQTKRWTIAPDKFKSALVGRCVIDAVKGWKFPQFTGRAMPVDFPVRVRGK